MQLITTISPCPCRNWTYFVCVKDKQIIYPIFTHMISLLVINIPPAMSCVITRVPYTGVLIRILYSFSVWTCITTSLYLYILYGMCNPSMYSNGFQSCKKTFYCMMSCVGTFPNNFKSILCLSNMHMHTQIGNMHI